MYVKKEIKRFFRNEGTQRAREQRDREDFYYSCIYDLLQKSSHYPKLNEKLKYFKAKIVRLNGREITNLQADLRDNVSFKDEQLSLYHIINVHKRRKKRLVTEIIDQEGNRHTTQEKIRRILHAELREGECGKHRRGLLRGSTYGCSRDGGCIGFDTHKQRTGGCDITGPCQKVTRGGWNKGGALQMGKRNNTG
jgi:hypothetical protein